jgi:hypothetical protein
MKLSLNRADLLEALQELIRELRARNVRGEIRIVGGAALSLSYFERDVTQDIDVMNVRGGDNEAVAEAARSVASRLDLNDNWLNFEVTQSDALPTLGREVEWHTIFSSAKITIQVASSQALLAMKLRANRPGRDVNDIRALLELVGVTDLASAERLYESFYPGGVLPDRAIQILDNLFAEVDPPKISVPPTPTFDGD